MTASHALLELVIVLGTAALITLVFEALRLPVVLGYVLAGLVIGPHVPVPLVADPQLVRVLSELGVIVLMFCVGLELRISRLARVGLAAGLTAVFEVALASAAAMTAARLLGLPADQALFAGAALGISSTMLVARAFEDRGWKGGFVDTVFAILIFEDLIAIVMLAVLGGVASGAGLGARDLAVTLAGLAGFLVAMLVGGLLVVPRLVRWIAERGRSETLLVVALAACFGGAMLAEHAGYSVALGAFIAGLLIAESGRGHAVFALIRPLRDVLAMVFFVAVGMTIAPGDIWANAPAIAVLAAVVLVVKPLGVALGVTLAGRGVTTAVRTGLSLAQVGELSFVIAGIAVTAGIAQPSLLAIVVGVACVTTLTSTLLIGRSEQIAGGVAARLPRRVAVFETFYEAWLARLRAGDRTRWHRLRRPVRVLAIDAAALFAIAIAAGALAPRFGIAVPIAGLALAVPFAVGVIRRIAAIARGLAAEAVPITGDPVDLGQAPRRVLALTLELAIVLAIAVPLVAVIAPFATTGGLLVLGAIAVLGVVTYRSIVDFDHHVRAGSELVLELLARGTAREQPLDRLDTLLPGFTGIVSLHVPASSPSVGKSLADLDVRARTGATVLAIARGDHGLATPSPTEPLREGDVLALAGSDDAIAAARTLLNLH